MKAHTAALRAIVAATKCLDGTQSYAGFAETILEIRQIATEALAALPENSAAENKAIYLDAKLMQARDFLRRIQRESHDRWSIDLAELGITGIRCARCGVESLDNLDDAQALGWRIMHRVRGSAYFLCPEHSDVYRQHPNSELVSRPQSAELGPAA